MSANGRTTVAGLPGPTLRRVLIWLGAVLVGINVLSAAFDILADRGAVEREALRSFRNLTAILAEQTARSLDAAELLVRSTTEDISRNGLGNLQERSQRMKDRVSGVPQIRALVVFDREGRLLVASDELSRPGDDFSDRPYFTAQRDGIARGLYVSDPFRGRYVNQWNFALSLPLRDSSGRFAGVVAAIIDTNHFENLYRSLDMGKSGFVSLLTRSGRLVVRAPPRPEWLGEEPRNQLAAIRIIEETGSYVGWTHSLFETGSDLLLVSAQPIPKAPMVVAVGMYEDAVFAPWRAETFRVVVRTILTSLAMAMFLVVASRELARRMKADAETVRQRALLDELFESAPEAVALVDLEGQVMRSNREFTRLFGYTGAEARGKLLLDLIVPEFDREPASRFWAASHRISVERKRRRKDGSLIDLLVTACPVLLEGRPIAIYSMYIDMTERKRAEAEQARLQERVRQAEKMEAVGRLAGGIAHDFNNVLGGILGYGEMLLEGAPEASAERQYARNVLAAANRARDLVDQILAYSRTGKVERRPVEIGAIVRETLDVVRGFLPPGIALDLALPQASLAAIGDPTQIHQVVMNLCTNAIHAMGEKGRLSVSVHAVDVVRPTALAQGTLMPGRYVKLAVADTGTGMDRETLAHIFEPFFTTKEVGHGTGLGLSLVYGIVTDSGGAADVASEPGRGSTFEIYLPRADVEICAAEGGEDSVPRGNGQRILLVDDEKPLLIVTAEVLKCLGYETETFADPQAALAALEAAPRAYDLLLTDETMPGMRGTELVHAALRLRPGMPVVVISGHTGPMLEQEARAAGAREVLKKPLQPRELAAALARAFAA